MTAMTTAYRYAHGPARRRGAALLAAAVLAFAGCGDDSSDEPTSAPAPSAASASTPAVEAIEVVDVWARSSPSTSGAGAAYFELTNTGAVDDALVAARVDRGIAATAEIHEVVPASESADGMGATETTMDTGGMGGAGTAVPGAEMMVMQQIERLDVPAGDTVVLAPGGYHIMLLDLVNPLTAGDSFDITLVFEQYGELTVTANVRDTAP